jgi:hypothetical protein
MSKLSDFFKKHRPVAYCVAQTHLKIILDRLLLPAMLNGEKKQSGKKRMKRNRESNNIFDVMVLVGE